MRDSSAIPNFLVVDTLEVLCAPKRDIDVVKLATRRDIPRILDIQLQPEVIVIIPIDVPIKFDRMAVVRI